MSPKTRVVTLAAGRGSRLGIDARHPAKFMTELGGKTLLDWQRAAFTRAGLHERLLVVRPDSALQTDAGERCLHVSGMGGPMDSLFAIDRRDAEGEIIVCYADIVFHPDIVTGLLGAEGSDICIVADLDWLALWSSRFDSVLDDAESFRANGTVLLEIGGQAKDPAEIEAQFIGMMRLSPRGFERLRALRQAGDDSTKLLARALKNDIPISVFHIDGRWCEVDTQRDIACYRKAIKASAPWSHDWREH